MQEQNRNSRQSSSNTNTQNVQRRRVSNQTPVQNGMRNDNYYTQNNIPTYQDVRRQTSAYNKRPMGDPTSQRRTPPAPNMQMNRQGQHPTAKKRTVVKKKKKQDLYTRALRLLVPIFVFLLIIVFIVWIVNSCDKPDDPGTETTDAATTDGVSTEPPETTAAATTAPPANEPEIPAVTFVADLTSYEAYMDPQGEERDAYLLLVNNTYPLDKTYAPTDLIDVIYTRQDGRAMQKMRTNAAKALESMLTELYANGYSKNGPGGYPVTVTSAYRTFAYQNSLFNQYMQNEMTKDPSLTPEEAAAITATYSARPGTSEHQSGLCCDIHNLSGADKTFGNQPEAKWLWENCWKFGFILRFPADKTDITGIDYEPWHFRYVGRYHAYQIMSQGLCLEEYLEMIK